MSLRLRIVMAVILLAALITIINMVRKRALELKYVLGWIVCVITLLIIDIFPELIDNLNVFLGIKTPINTIFFLGFLFALIIIFSLTVALSRVTDRVRKLAQMVALKNDDYIKDNENKE